MILNWEYILETNSEQTNSALKVYENIDAKSGDILEKILEREGMLDVFST